MTLRYFIALFRIETADSAQPRKGSMVTRCFPCNRVGSEHKTRPRQGFHRLQYGEVVEDLAGHTSDVEGSYVINSHPCKICSPWINFQNNCEIFGPTLKNCSSSMWMSIPLVPSWKATCLNCADCEWISYVHSRVDVVSVVVKNARDYNCTTDTQFYSVDSSNMDNTIPYSF